MQRRRRPRARPLDGPAGDPARRRARRPARGARVGRVAARRHDPGARRARTRAHGHRSQPARFAITEKAAIAGLARARAFAESLTRLGCRFALDNFGTGGASFYSLKHLPLDYLKIDGRLIEGLTNNARDQHLVESLVDVARGMGMTTIAERVETEDTVALLREQGVEYSQGGLHGAPRPVAVEFALPALTP